MPSAIEQTAQLVKQPARLATGVRLPLTPIMRGHSNPGERSNNGVGSRGLDNNGAKSGESGDRAGRRALVRGCSQIAMSRLTGKCRHEGTEHSHWQKPKMHTFNAAQL